MLLRLLCISLLPALIAGQEFQCGTDKIQSDIAKTVVQFNCKDKVADINKCCISHDGCYDQQQPRGTCDATFCSCVQAASVGNPLCGFYTNLFCDTAKVFGEPAYKKVGEEVKKRREKADEEAKAAAAAAAAAAINLEVRLRKEEAAARKAAAKAATTLVASAPEPAVAAAAAAAATTTASSVTIALPDVKKADTVKLTITKHVPKKEEAKVEEPKHEPKKEDVKTEEATPVTAKVEEAKPEVAKEEEKIEEAKPEVKIQEKKGAGESRHKEEKLPGEKGLKRAEPSSTITSVPAEKKQTSSEEDAELADLEARLAREERDLERAEAEQRRVLDALAARKAALREELRSFRAAQRALWRAKEESAASSDDAEETTAVVAPATTPTVVPSSTTTMDPILKARSARQKLEMRARHEFMKKKAEERKARASKTLKIEPTSTTTIAPVENAEEPVVTVTSDLVEGSGHQERTTVAGAGKWSDDDLIPEAESSTSLLQAGEAKSKATAAEAPTPAPAATPSPYIPVQQGQSGPEVVAAAEAAAAAQAAAYRAAKKVTPNPLAFTPFPDPMEKMREWMQPRTRGTPAPVTPDPAEIERMRVQKLARAEFERTIEMSKQANAQLAIRDHQLEQLAEAKMRSMAERKHAHPTAAPPLAYGIPGDGGAGAALHEFQRSLKAEPKSMIVDERMIEASQQPSSSDGLALSPEQEERIAERVKEVMSHISDTYRKSFAQPQLKKIEPGSENAFSQDDNDDAVQQRASINIRRAPPSSSSTPSPSTASTPSLVPPPTTFNNLFHNVPSNSEPRPFAEVKTPSEATTVASVFHAKHSDRTTAALPENDPSATVFHRKDPLPITQFLQDHEAIDTLSSIDVGGLTRGEEEEERAPSQHLREGFTPVADEAGPFESLLQEAQEHLRQSQQRVDQLIKDQRLKIEREEKERKRLLEEVRYLARFGVTGAQHERKLQMRITRRLKLAEQRRLLEARKRRREEKRKARLALQRQLAERANESEWSRRLDQEAKVKALEDSTRVPDNSLEEDAPTTTTKKRSHHKKHRPTTTAEPEDDEDSSVEDTKSRRKHSRHAKNELDSDSYEAYEQWLRWREKRKLARRKHANESEAEE
ncbi:hypothetical protein PRIPAC_71411 [Pristionchus pacificus]|uniref:Uncharacterized protein n=1 Tax=Pristionchus pacificus TaxID=54126 RepID=A0A2A6C0V9_PRIPA|nr:hypothetical protein PRIPAC_71411 [Pristionchus pacificus]|eukprot:PDM71736.1 hypothetical protein PRIPAC_38143 [Pristionchus pacificus]